MRVATALLAVRAVIREHSCDSGISVLNYTVTRGVSLLTPTYPTLDSSLA